MFIAVNTLSPLGTDPLCAPPVGNNPGFPWCASTLPGAFYLPNTAPGVHDEGNHTGYLAMIKSTGQLLYCTSLGCAGEDDGVYAVTVANGRVSVVGWNTCEDYATGCAAPTNGLPQCNALNPFTWPIAQDQSGNNLYFIQQFRVNDLQLVWSSSIGEGEPTDISGNVNGKLYVTGKGGIGSVPLMSNSGYYSSTLPGTGEGTYVLGFSDAGQFWGTLHGDHITPFAVASRTLARIYIAGERGDYGFVPYHCPWTVDPWCVDNPAISNICYSQLKITLPVGTPELANACNSALAIFPNPSLSSFTIRGIAQGDELVQIVMTDALGREVLRESEYAAEGRLNITAPPLSPGIYHVRICQAAGRWSPPLPLVIQP